MYCFLPAAAAKTAVLRDLTWEKLRGNGRLPKHDDPSTFDVAQKRSQEKSSDWEVVYK